VPAEPGNGPGSTDRASILVVTSSYPSVRAPYNGVFVAEQARALRERGHDVSVLAPRVFADDRRKGVDERVVVHRFPFLSGQRLLGEYDGTPVIRMMTYLISGAFTARQLVRSLRPRVVHAHWIVPTGLVAAIGIPRRTPLVLTAHGTDVRLAAEGSPLIRRLAALALRRADRIIAVSEALKTRLVDDLAVNASKVQVVSMGVDDALFRSRGRQLARRDLDLPDDAPIALFVGGLLSDKGIRQLVEAWDSIHDSQPNARLLLVGRGPLEGELREWIASRSTNDVTLLGPVPHHALPHLMDAADVLVLPTLSEGLGMVLLEAGAMGLPVVASDVGGCREAASSSDRNILVPPGDVIALSGAVAQALARPAPDVRASTLGEQGRRFTQAAVLDTLEAIYSALR